MSVQHKAIRSSSWKTDFIIGFPEGLLLLFFTTLLSEGLPITVQKFYTVNTLIWGIGSLLVAFTAWQANKGDTQHDESKLSSQERSKLENLQIGDKVIAVIEAEMEKDARQWENTLQTEQVEETHFRRGPAIRSAIVTGLSFLAGGILAFLPYLRDENFRPASKTSTGLTFIVIIVFSVIKSRFTSQSTIPVILRNIFYTAAVFAGATILQLIFRR
jgi:vacuolar iron transporter family protein